MLVCWKGLAFREIVASLCGVGYYRHPRAGMSDFYDMDLVKQPMNDMFGGVAIADEA